MDTRCGWGSGGDEDDLKVEPAQRLILALDRLVNTGQGGRVRLLTLAAAHDRLVALRGSFVTCVLGEVLVEFGEGGFGIGLTVPGFPELGEGRVLDVLSVFDVAFGGGAFGLPFGAECMACLFEDEAGGFGVVASPCEISLEKETAGGAWVGERGGGEVFFGFLKLATEEGDFAQHEEGAGFLGIDGAGLEEGVFCGGQVGIGRGEERTDDAPLLPGAMASGVEFLERGQGVERGLDFALAGEAEAEVIAGVLMLRIEVDGLAEERDGFGVIALDHHGVHGGALYFPELEESLFIVWRGWG
jgi:hypothetical protein